MLFEKCGEVNEFEPDITNVAAAPRWMPTGSKPTNRSAMDEAKRARRDSFGPWGDPSIKYLYYCPDMKELAHSIATQPTRLDIRPMEVSWAKFPDGFPNLFIEGAEEIRGKHVAFLASFNNPDTIFEQISVIYLSLIHI